MGEWANFQLEEVLPIIPLAGKPWEGYKFGEVFLLGGFFLVGKNDKIYS